MKTIAIEYLRLGLKHSVTSSIPTKWDEVTPKQLIVIAKNYLGECSDDLMLSTLCSLNRRIIHRLDSYQKFQIAEQLNFLTDYKPFSHFIINKIGILHAPKPRLQAMSFGQFMFVDSYYSDSLQSQKDEDLNKFISALYIPKGKPFKQENLIVYELIAERYPVEVKCAISINYRLVKEFLTHAYPLVFLKALNGQKGKENLGWVKVFESVVGDDIVNHDKYAELSVHVVLRWISKKVKENAKR